VQGFVPQARPVAVNSNLPIVLSISLSVAGANEQINVAAQENLVDPASAGSATTLTENFIQRAPRINRGHQLQELVATVPGMAPETTAMSTVREAEDAFSSVLMATPIPNRLNPLSAAHSILTQST